MTQLVRVTVEDCIDVYRGVKKDTGNEYVIGTWKVRGILDGKVFAAKAFTDNHKKLEECKGLIIDVLISIEGKEYNGKMYNDVIITEIKKEEVKVDVPGMEMVLPESGASVADMLVNDNDNVLPF